MKTSNYAKKNIDKNAVSIAARCPSWFKGREYKKLAPNYSFFIRYKKDGDEEAYTKSFYREILDMLDAKQVFEELGENAILLCYESAGKFCHRRIVAEWFEKELGIKVEEI